MKKELLVLVVGVLMVMGNAWGVPSIGFVAPGPGLDVPLNDNLVPVNYGRWSVNTGAWTYDGDSATIASPTVNVNSALRFSPTPLWEDSETMPMEAAATQMPAGTDWGFELTYKHTGGYNGGIPWFLRDTAPNNSYDYRMVSLWQVGTSSWTIKVGDATGDGWVNAVTGLDLSDGAFHKFTTHYKAANQRLDIYVDDVLMAENVQLVHGHYTPNFIQIEDADAAGTDSYGYVKIGQIVPEPMTLVLMSLGGLLLRRRRSA
ncbi:MAG: PEP-CTERM sorting domain-containing protein [Phycisphaerae bacterium]